MMTNKKKLSYAGDYGGEEGDGVGGCLLGLILLCLIAFQLQRYCFEMCG
jgi:hypothetical protein